MPRPRNMTKIETTIAACGGHYAHVTDGSHRHWYFDSEAAMNRFGDQRNPSNEDFACSLQGQTAEAGRWYVCVYLSLPTETPSTSPDRDLLIQAYKRLLRVDPAGDKPGTVAEAIMNRLSRSNHPPTAEELFS